MKKPLVSHAYLEGWLLSGACGKVGSQLNSEGMSWSLRPRMRAQDQVVSLGGGKAEAEGQQLPLVCFISCVLPFCPSHCHFKCGVPGPRPGALGWWLSGQWEGGDFPEAMLQGLVASLFVPFGGSRE